MYGYIYISNYASGYAMINFVCQQLGHKNLRQHMANEVMTKQIIDYGTVTIDQTNNIFDKSTVEGCSSTAHTKTIYTDEQKSGYKLLLTMCSHV